MTRRDTEARSAELAQTAWPRPPGVATHPMAAWTPREVACDCDECLDGREAARRRPPGPAPHSVSADRQHLPRAALATAALARSASRNASLLSRRLEELARALEHDDDGVLARLAEALDSDLDHTGSLLEALGVELECRRDG